MHKRIEEYTLNAWPGLRQYVFDGWLLRWADGYTKRANSVQPIYSGTEPIERKIDFCESFYFEAGLPAIFKITPFLPDADLDECLAERGYAWVEPSCVRIRDLAAIDAPRLSDMRIATAVDDEWLAALTRFLSLPVKSTAVIRQLLAPSQLRKGFFTLFDHAEPVACGAGVLENGWLGLYEIAVSPAHRNQGYGKELILHMLQWAGEQGATRSYLQVVKRNVPAMRLYGKLGYREVYDYGYRVKERQQ